MKWFLSWILVIVIATLTAGCTAMSEAAQQVSEDLGDKAVDSNVFVSIIKVTPSDPTTNFSPTVKQLVAMGRVKSVPLVSKKGEMVKDYAEYRKTKTSAWYSSSIVTEEEVFISTGDKVGELKAWYENLKKEEQEKKKQTPEVKK
jgi:hypothetical protein